MNVNFSTTVHQHSMLLVPYDNVPSYMVQLTTVRPCCIAIFGAPDQAMQIDRAPEAVYEPEVLLFPDLSDCNEASPL